MNPPDSQPGDEQHPGRVWWRRWAGSIALFLIVVTSAIGFFYLEGVVDDLAHEGSVREKQFCHVVLTQHHARLRRDVQTREFLQSPAGRERTALNMYIRTISLPRQEEEYVEETASLPAVCSKYQNKHKGEKS